MKRNPTNFFLVQWLDPSTKGQPIDKRKVLKQKGLTYEDYLALPVEELQHTRARPLTESEVFDEFDLTDEA